MSEETEIDPDFAGITDVQQQQRYLIQRLRVRRRMAIAAFLQLLAGGAAIIIGGLIIPTWAMRIDHMGTFLSIYFGALATVVGAYWGLGTYEHNASMSSRFGFGGYGGGGYGSQDMNRPHLVKTGSKSVTTSETLEVETHRSPDGL